MEINNLITQYLVFLAKKQKENGSFCSLVSHLKNDFKYAYENESLLSTAFVIISLIGFQDETAQIITKKAAAFLLSKKNDDWSFNKNLNTAFLAITAILQTEPEKITGEDLVKILKLLTGQEIKEGGPYRTFTDKERIDLGTNIAIAYFLKKKAVELPELDKLIAEAISSRELRSFPYYSPLPTTYILSLFYNCPANLADSLLLNQDKEGKWDNLLDTIFAITSLLHFGTDPDLLQKNINFLLSRSLEEITEPHIFLLTQKENQDLFIASPAVNLALYLDALKTYKNKLGEKADSKNQEQENYFYGEIIEAAYRKTGNLPEDLQKKTREVLDKIIKKDLNREIIFLPYFFQKSLREKKEIQEALIKDLGVANLFIWTAYTIYDDFLDEEGDPQFLSSANFCLREFTLIFKNILPGPHWRIFSEIMDCLDAANTWEIMHCRAKISGSEILLEKIPDFSQCNLADRSLAHALGPIAILALYYTDDSQAREDLILFFKHYLTARQLNDEAHDWEEDLKRGQINYVVAEILKACNKKEINLAEDLAGLQKLFWEEILVQASSEVLRNIESAKNYGVKLSGLIEPAFFQKLLTSTENSAKKALKEQKEFFDFLKTYKK